jgi:hypothetical protein
MMYRIRLSGLTAMVVVTLLIGTSVSQAEVIGGPIVWPETGGVYYLLDHSSWTAAEAEAVTLSGHLVTINDAEENAWVHETFCYFDGSGYRSLWIGLNDAENEGVFVWSSGEEVTYTNWYPGEPNGAYSNEDYAHIGYSGDRWIDRRNSEGSIIYGVVEAGPVPVKAISWGSAKSVFRDAPR